MAKRWLKHAFFAALCAQMSLKAPLTAAINSPLTLELQQQGKIIYLNKTGQAIRESLYQVEHYLEGAIYAKDDVILAQIHSDGEAKELLFTFHCDKKADALANLFAEDLKKSMGSKQALDLQKETALFLSGLKNDVQVNDQLAFLWTAGGHLKVFFNGDQTLEMTSIPFNQALWKVWLGRHHVLPNQSLISFFENIEPTLTN
ncbi:MAG: Chalcone isomerase-like [Chlamydiales bacterium]|nr:Chalcone isomerase-like [Chlamydiales bacterium]